MPFLELRDIVKRYGDVTAVDDVSLSIAEGEFISILGPSGSGKTTTLELIAGFERPDSGEIRLQGADIVDLPPEDRSMSMVFQDLALFPHMTVSENISFGLRMRTDLSAAEIDARVEDALELVELSGYGDRKVTQLSGGEQQRVALSRAIVVEPDVLLFDEPLSDLDRQLRETMRHEIAALHDELEITSVYVTHNQREALTLGDRVAVMRDGRIEQIGLPEEVYTAPANQFVAQFVGDANFLTGNRAQRDGELWFTNDEFAVPLSDVSSPPEATPEETLTLLVRPEELRLGTAGQPEQTASCVVETVHHLESVTEYTVRTDEGTELLVTGLGVPEYRKGEQTTVTITDYDVVS